MDEKNLNNIPAPAENPAPASAPVPPAQPTAPQYGAPVPPVPPTQPTAPQYGAPVPPVPPTQPTAPQYGAPVPPAYGQPFQPPMYGAQPYGMPYVQPQKKSATGLAIASMIMGILSIVIGCCNYIPGLVFGTLALIFSIVDRAKSPEKKFSGMALAGFIMGIIGLVFAVVDIVMVIFFEEMLDEYLQNSFAGSF